VPADAASPVNGSGVEYPQGTLFPITDGTANGTFISIPTTWATMTRGFNEDEMTGRDIFLKWLHVKRRLSWSTEKMTEWNYRVRCRCVHGWVMLPGCTPVTGQNTDHVAEVTNVLKEEFSKVLAGPDKTKVRILSDRIVTRMATDRREARAVPEPAALRAAAVRISSAAVEWSGQPAAGHWLRAGADRPPRCHYHWS
jgi:hypothetical protein